MRLLARPVFFFFFSCGSTLGVWPLTLPARAREPCTLPPTRRTSTSSVARFSSAARLAPFSRGFPAQNTASSSDASPSSRSTRAFTSSTVSVPCTSRV
uniref:Mr_precursor_153 n=1 Tax=Conus marmoreus TaxID=42752 RepID=U6C2F1_CONMR|nr:Mr_precursor_153 [Conus marmoreus]